jgi:hypothetical protein
LNTTEKPPRVQPRPGRKAALTFLIFIMLAGLPPGVRQAESGESTTLSFLKFGTGMLTAYALHESGHAVAASLTGTDLDWGVGTYNQPLGFRENADNDTAGMLVHAAGLTTQILSSEVILQSDSIDKNDSMVRGMMAWNILNPIIYTLDYWVLRRTNQEHGNCYQGDLEGFEHYTDDGSATLFAATMAGLAVFQGYRFMETQTWAPAWMKQKAFQLTYQLREDQGFQMTVQIDF